MLSGFHCAGHNKMEPVLLHDDGCLPIIGGRAMHAIHLDSNMAELADKHKVWHLLNITQSSSVILPIRTLDFNPARVVIGPARPSGPSVMIVLEIACNTIGSTSRNKKHCQFKV